MLELSLAVLAAAAAGGSALAVVHLRGGGRRLPPLWAGAGHGTLGLAGLALLLAALLGQAPDAVAVGARGFGPTALVLLGLAAALGMIIQTLRVRGRRPPGLLLAAHASLAVFGLVVLLPYVLL